MSGKLLSVTKEGEDLVIKVGGSYQIAAFAILGFAATISFLIINSYGLSSFNAILKAEEWIYLVYLPLALVLYFFTAYFFHNKIIKITGKELKIKHAPLPALYPEFANVTSSFLKNRYIIKEVFCEKTEDGFSGFFLCAYSENGEKIFLVPFTNLENAQNLKDEIEKHCRLSTSENTVTAEMQKEIQHTANLFFSNKTSSNIAKVNYTDENRTEMVCPHCNEAFALENLDQGSKYQITCPKCNVKFYHKTKLTDVKLPKDYTTFIDENKDLVIRKRLKSHPLLILLTISFIGFTIWVFDILLTRMLTATEIADKIEALSYLIFLILLDLGGIYASIDTLCNTREIRVGSDFLKIFIHPYPLFRKDKFYSSDELEEIYCEQTGGSSTFCDLKAIMKNGKNISLITECSDLEETRALEILIEKRLGIKDRPVECETMV